MVGLLLQGVWGSLVALEGGIARGMAVTGSQSCLMVQT